MISCGNNASVRMSKTVRFDWRTWGLLESEMDLNDAMSPFYLHAETPAFSGVLLQTHWPRQAAQSLLGANPSLQVR